MEIAVDFFVVMSIVVSTVEVSVVVASTVLVVASAVVLASSVVVPISEAGKSSVVDMRS